MLEFLKKIGLGWQKKALPKPEKAPMQERMKLNGEGQNGDGGLFVIKSKEVAIGNKPDLMPTGIRQFDLLIHDGGFERGSTILVSGGAGTGKTTFSLQSIYAMCMAGGKGIYLSFEEDPKKIKAHMKKNYEWDFEKLEKKGQFAIIKIDPTDVSRAVEQVLVDREGELKIDMKKIDLPFLPDVVAVDSLSALSIAFSEEQNYRKYIRELFESLEKLGCTSYVISETEQNPKIYSRTGV
ncbi:MAG: AAA family ATPase, partial [archaeon]|nr:AAA family ATPase [archaeon]